MSNYSNPTHAKPSSPSRKNKIDYPKHETPEDQAQYMKLVEDYPNVVARRLAMLRVEPPLQPSKKEGQ